MIRLGWAIGMVMGAAGVASAESPAAAPPLTQLAASSAPASDQPVYASDPRLDEFLEAAFPRRIPARRFLTPYVWRHQQIAYPTVDAVLKAFLDAEFEAEVRPRDLLIPLDHIESYWLSIDKSNDRWRTYLSSDVPEQIALLADSLAAVPPRFSSPLEKALFQRDVYQTFSFSHRALRQAEASGDAELRAKGTGIVQSLAYLWRRLRLSAAEWSSLEAIRPPDIPAIVYTTERTPGKGAALARPDGEESAWFEFKISADATRHFQDFGGRSFVRTFIRAPGMTDGDIRRYWADSFAKHGARRHTTRETAPLPAGTETMLIRTFAVALEDNTLRDSGFPEEALMRVFKYPSARLDLESGDFLGTRLYQYKMRRAALLRDPRSLGLERIDEDQVEFAGFFAEAPDPHNTVGEPVTTMRFNCITCHSPVFYGASTVFSFNLDPEGATDSARGRTIRVNPSLDGEGYRLQSPEFQALLDLIGEGVEPAPSSERDKP